MHQLKTQSISKSMNEQPTKNTQTMPIIDSSINSLAEIVEQIGELKCGERAQIQCRTEQEWMAIPDRLKGEFEHVKLRCTRTMDDTTLIIKVMVLGWKL